MKKFRQAALIAGVLTAGLMSAQSTNTAEKSMRNTLKVGLNAGIAVPNENLSASVGADVAYQYLVTPSFGLGIASGYTQYFKKNNDGLKNNSVGVIPAAALLRFYPQKTGFYFGSDVGYGFLTGNDKVASNADVKRPDGGFYIKPQVGFHNRDWNFFVQYQKVFVGSRGDIANQKYNVGNIGVGATYNIALGK
ncbi:hypothetical protein [Chryseobacterium sp.]|uniref:hypothetical protein n=1 Tax=Chryseobacterium sp. TaxID=1871047 RepID=UPI0025C30DC9|nr:hypothetical protein [Chryseobacterium sp.]